LVSTLRQKEALERQAAGVVGVDLNQIEMSWMRVTLAAEEGLRTVQEMKAWPSWGTFQAAEPFEIWAREQLDRFSHHEPPLVYDQNWPERIQHIFFCTTCFRRSKQLKAALSLNVLALASHRLRVTIVLVTFAEDLEVVQWVLHNFKWAIDCKLLLLASGGAYGAAEPKPDNPNGYWSEVPGGWQTLRYWHASKAKNISHRVAIASFPADLPAEKVILVNFDCDNIVGPGYVLALAEKCSQAAEPFGTGPVPAVSPSLTGPVTGRLAMNAKTFMARGGYDDEQNVCGSGHIFSRLNINNFFLFFFTNLGQASKTST
jgi:hypothetical protein